MMPSISFTALTNLGSIIPWGLWVSVYVLLIGISTATFLIVCISALTANDVFKPVRSQLLLLSLCTLGAGLACINLDLGHIERSWELFVSLNPFSPMSWMGKLYPLYGLLLAFVLIPKRCELSKPVAIFGVVASVVLMIVESLLFAMPPGKSWHSLLTPIHFLAAACASAVFAAMLCVRGLPSLRAQKTEPVSNGIRRIALAIVTAFLLIEVVEVFHSGGASHPSHWVGFAVVFLSLIGFSRTSFTAIASIAGLLGIGLSKYMAIVSAQLHPPLAGYDTAYIEPRMMFQYAPSGFEWFAVIAVIAGCIAALHFADKLIHFLQGNHSWLKSTNQQ